MRRSAPTSTPTPTPTPTVPGRGITAALDRALALGAALLLGGCAAFDPGADWRHGKVVQLVPPDAVAAVSADRRCLGGPTEQQAGEQPTVAIVRYRVTRAYFRQAFPLPKDMALAVGDAVMVTPDGCELGRWVAAEKAMPTP